MRRTSFYLYKGKSNLLWGSRHDSQPDKGEKNNNNNNRNGKQRKRNRIGRSDRLLFYMWKVVRAKQILVFEVKGDGSSQLNQFTGSLGLGHSPPSSLMIEATLSQMFKL